MKVAQAVLFIASLVLLACSCSGAEANCVELDGQPDAPERRITCYGYPGVEGLAGPWMPYKLDINCTSAQYKVYTSSELDGNLTETLWCGLKSLNDPTVCHLTLSSRLPVYVTLRGAGAATCSWSAVHGPDLLRLGLAVSGTSLFLSADSLAMSQVFRLSAGAATFMSGAILLLLLVTLRSLPQKRAVMAAMAVSTSTVMGMVRWVYGTWMPAWHTVLTSRAMIWYLILTGLLGLAATYMCDDLHNVKVNNIIKSTLKLLGLLLLYNGSTDEPVSLALVASLGIGSILLPRLWPVGRWLGRALWYLATALLRLVQGAIDKLQQQSNRDKARMHLTPRDKSVSLDAWVPHQEQEDLAGGSGLGQHPQHYPGSGGAAGFRRPQPRPQQQHTQHVDIERTALRGTPFSQARVLHFSTPPPAPSTMGSGLRASPMATPSSAGGGSKSSPFSHEKVVLDIGRRTPAAVGRQVQLQEREVLLPSHVPTGRQQGLGRGAAAADVEHDLIQRGKVINPLTGKEIDMGKKVFKDLVADGWHVDSQQGTMFKEGVAAVTPGRGAGSSRARRPA